MPSGWVDINVSGQTMEGYLTQPEGSDQHPAVVVIQEIWGVNSHIQYMTDRLPAIRLGRATRVRVSDVERLARESLPAEGGTQ